MFCSTVVAPVRTQAHAQAQQLCMLPCTFHACMLPCTLPCVHRTKHPLMHAHASLRIEAHTVTPCELLTLIFTTCIVFPCPQRLQGLTCMDITATYQTDAAHFATSPDYTNDTALVQLPATTDIVKTVCL